MLESTFCHIKGIGIKSERELWARKIYNWESFLSASKPPVSKSKYLIITNALKESCQALENLNHSFFYKNLPTNQHWRLFNRFINRTAYIDIETTGLNPSYDKITTIVMYDGNNINYYVHGINLEKFSKDIIKYDLIVTYNGKCFDIPFIEHYFKMQLPHSHIDLRYVLSSLGYKGGLKEIEKRFNLKRKGLEDVDGFFAVLLWKKYIKTKNKKVLETLLAYNMEDTVNLEHLMYSAFNKKIKETPFRSQLILDIPNTPKIPFSPDLDIINELKEKYYFN